jgi:hypothetical protein
MQPPSGLDLLIIRAEEDIPAGIAVIIHYDRRANASDKLIVPPRVEDPLDLDPDVHYFSGMSECNIWDRLDGLKSEDNDLDDALRDLRNLWPENPTTIGRAGADNNTGNGTEDLPLPQGMQESTPRLCS